MPQQWQVKVKRLQRYQIPLVTLRLNGPTGLEVEMAIATSEPFTTLAPDIAGAVRHDLIRFEYQIGPPDRLIVEQP